MVERELILMQLLLVTIAVVLGENDQRRLQTTSEITTKTVTFISSQIYTFPPNVNQVQFTMSGCNGDKGNTANLGASTGNNVGGLAEILSGTFNINALEGSSTTFWMNVCSDNIGGYNGDSNGGSGGGAVNYNAAGGSGGGATDIRYGGSGLQNRILVAGGGGGGGYDNLYHATVGANAGAVGGSAPGPECGLAGGISDPTGGTQSSGGSGGCKNDNYCGGNGGLGSGGNSYSATFGGSPGGGGGGGYYGGGGGNGCGGAGGSSYADPRIAASITSSPTTTLKFQYGYIQITYSYEVFSPTTEPTTKVPSQIPSIVPSTTSPSFTAQPSTFKPTANPTTASPSGTIYNFVASGTYEYNIPVGSVSVDFIMLGCSGGNVVTPADTSSYGSDTVWNAGGVGTELQGTLDSSSFNSSQTTLLAVVCGVGSGCTTNGICYAGSNGGLGGGGYNGGGNAYIGTGGGGATDLRLSADLNSRIAVAAGGGGAGLSSSDSVCEGGKGQWTEYSDGFPSSECGSITTSTGGGSSGGGVCPSSTGFCNGALGLGGNGGSMSLTAGSGGGGGYFGGAGGTIEGLGQNPNNAFGPGAGGSDYINPTYVTSISYGTSNSIAQGGIRLVTNYPTTFATVVITVGYISQSIRRSLRKIDDDNYVSSLKILLIDHLKDLLRSQKFRLFAVTIDSIKKVKASKLAKINNVEHKAHVKIGTIDASNLQKIVNFIHNLDPTLRDKSFAKTLVKHKNFKEGLHIVSEKALSSSKKLKNHYL